MKKHIALYNRHVSFHHKLVSHNGGGLHHTKRGSGISPLLLADKIGGLLISNKNVSRGGMIKPNFVPARPIKCLV